MNQEGRRVWYWDSWWSSRTNRYCRQSSWTY